MGFFRNRAHRNGASMPMLCDQFEELTHEAELERTESGPAESGLTDAALQAVLSIGQIADQVCVSLETLARKKVGATEQVRAFRDEHGINHDPLMPDRLSTLMILLFCLIGEGGLGGVLFFAGGKADLFISMIYGFSVAGINVTLGIVNGFLFGRHLGYKLDAPEPKPRDAWIRIGAWIGFLVSCAMVVVLAFAAARVRATGSPVDIFDFSEVGVLGTFADYYGILLIVLGLLGGIVAMREGWVGLSDPTPGYARIWKQAEKELRDAALAIADQGHDAMDDIYEAMADPCDDALDDHHERADTHHETAADLKARTARHNLDVKTARDNARRAFDAKHARQEMIKHGTIDGPDFDAAPYDALILPIPDQPVSDLPHDDLSALAAAHQKLEVAWQQGGMAIDQAYAGFLVGISGPVSTSLSKGVNDNG